MIKATEARELVKQSDASVEMLLKWIDLQVRKLAEEGKTSFDVYHDEIMVRGEGYSASLIETPLMKKIAEKLSTFGYRVVFVTAKQENKFPGLGVYDEDDYKDRPPSYIRHITISW